MIDGDRENRIRLDELLALYEKRWGKPVDYVGIPPVLTTDKMVKVLERIIDTGESVTVGFEKVRKGES